MWFLIGLILLFVAVVAFIIYANWPAPSTGKSCADDCTGCPKCQKDPCNQCSQPKQRCRCPCNRCGQSKRQCHCPKKKECDFC